MITRPPRSTLTYTRFPFTTLCRSLLLALLAAASVVDARTCFIPAISNGFLVAGGIVTALTGPGIAMIALAAAAYLLLAVIARLAAWLSSTTDPASGNGDILMLAAGMLWVSPSSALDRKSTRLNSSH